MSNTVVREYRLRETAYETLVANDMFPSRRPLLRHLEELAHSNSLETAGRSTGDFSAFKSRRPISRGFADGVVDFLLFNWHDDSHGLRELGLPLTPEPLFETLFERIPSDLPAKAYTPPTKANDPAVGSGFAALAGAVVHTIYGLGRPAEFIDSEACYLDPESGVADFLRMMNAETGYSQAKKREVLTVEEAYARGREFFDADAQAHEAIPKMLEANPNCARYALSDDGHCAGVSVAYPITDAAFDATLRGERKLYEHTAEDIRPRANNIVITGFAENHSLVADLSTFQKRKFLIGSLLLQIALLLDTDDRRPIRTISYEIIASNTKRLRSMGYQKVCSYRHPGGPSINVVVWDAMRRPYVTRCLMLVLDDFIWRIRHSIDGLP